ncbi:MAG: response regulator [Aestuariivirga sp.]|jgi:CheY-like chemotaxis protein
MALALQAAAAAPLVLRQRDGRRPRLLLAEDCDPVRIVTAAMLKGMGCDVDAVVHGEEAVRSACAQSFDVIVLDIEMPIMDGITAARSIRNLGGAVSATPIMALSAFLADAMQQASWSDTFDIALPKPANRNELHTAVQAALDWRPRQAADGEAPLINLQQMSDLSAGLSAGVFRELLNMACRDIEVCANQLTHLQKSAIRGADHVYVQKLMALGQSFAAPRLSQAAERVAAAGSLASRPQMISGLIVTAAATAAALRAH